MITGHSLVIKPFLRQQALWGRKRVLLQHFVPGPSAHMVLHRLGKQKKARLILATTLTLCPRVSGVLPLWIGSIL